MKVLKTMAITLAFAGLTGCSQYSIENGEEAVITKKPWFFGTSGVEPVTATTGTIFTALSTSVDIYNVKPVKIQVPFTDLNASDNVAIDFDVYLTVQIQKGKASYIHEKLGSEWYYNNVQDTFRSYVRNTVRTKSSIDLRTNLVVINEVQEELLKMVKAYFAEIDLPVNVIKVNIGKVVPPQEVLAESERTAAQKQRKLTQIERKNAEDSRADAEKAAAVADKAYADEFNMTADQFLRNKELDVISKATEKGGVSVIINASGAQPMFNAAK